MSTQTETGIDTRLFVGGAFVEAEGGRTFENRDPWSGDVVSDVEDKMSYGTFDWAITDSEATEALNELAALPAPGLADAMNRLLDLGADGIMTDKPSVLKDVLVQRGQWVV